MLLCVLCMAFLVSSTSNIALSREIPSTGHWQVYVPSGRTVNCQSITNQKDLELVLKKTGCDPKSNPFPAIDWNRDIAIIIAPPKNHNVNHKRQYKGLSVNENELTVRYEWITESRSLQYNNESGNSVITMGSRQLTEPSVTLVSFNRSLNR